MARCALQGIAAYDIEPCQSLVDTVARVKLNIVMVVELGGQGLILIPLIPPHLELHMQQQQVLVEPMARIVKIKFVITAGHGPEVTP